MQQGARAQEGRELHSPAASTRGRAHSQAELPSSWHMLFHGPVSLSLPVVLGKPYISKALAHYHLYMGLFGEHDPRQLSFANNQLRN